LGVTMVFRIFSRAVCPAPLPRPGCFPPGRSVGPGTTAVFTPPVRVRRPAQPTTGRCGTSCPTSFVAGGRAGRFRDPHQSWECGADLWAAGRFAVLHPDGARRRRPTCPPACKTGSEARRPRATHDIRAASSRAATARPDVPAEVEAYIRRYGLFSGTPSPRETRVRLTDLRLKLVYDERKRKARGFAARFGPVRVGRPDARPGDRGRRHHAASDPRPTGACGSRSSA